MYHICRALLHFFLTSGLTRLCLAQALWSEYTQDDATRNNATRQFCTEAFQIDVPQDRISDR